MGNSPPMARLNTRGAHLPSRHRLAFPIIPLMLRPAPFANKESWRAVEPAASLSCLPDRSCYRFRPLEKLVVHRCRNAMIGDGYRIFITEQAR
jgi:hypothetical protein